MRWEGNTYDEIGAHFGVARAVIHRHMHPNAKKLHRRRVTELELEMQELRERLEVVEARLPWTPFPGTVPAVTTTPRAP
jgi:hypothetical protein